MNNELKHFGILGMKWGIRRNRGSDGKVIPGTRDTTSTDYAKSRTLRKQSMKSMSNEELQTLNRRLQLEKQYKELNPSDFEKGIKFVKTLTAVGTTMDGLYKLTKTPLGQDVINAVKKNAKKASK